MNKIIVISKSAGLTSRDVVNKLSKILGTKKIGHTGTLDPMASGVLVCLIGKYTKLASIITSEEKEYISEIKLGMNTDTLDITGNITEEREVSKINKDEIIKVFNSLIGEYNQTIPLYSAVHVNGKRLYEYAREGKEVELPQNKVFIKELELIDYHDNIIKFRCVVSKGTYIRSLIQTICENLNTIGVMSSLVRTRQGKFKLEDAYTLEEIQNEQYKSLNIEDVLEITQVNLENNRNILHLVLNGNKLNLDYQGYVLFKLNKEEIALYNFKNNEGRLIIKIKE